MILGHGWNPGWTHPRPISFGKTSTVVDLSTPAAALATQCGRHSQSRGRQSADHLVFVFWLTNKIELPRPPKVILRRTLSVLLSLSPITTTHLYVLEVHKGGGGILTYSIPRRSPRGVVFLISSEWQWSSWLLRKYHIRVEFVTLRSSQTCATMYLHCTSMYILLRLVWNNLN